MGDGHRTRQAESEEDPEDLPYGPSRLLLALAHSTLSTHGNALIFIRKNFLLTV